MEHDADALWLQLIGRVQKDFSLLLSDFLAELETHEGYSDGSLPREDVESTAYRAFNFFLSRLAQSDDPAESARFSHELGRRRARQGVRFDHLIEAVRINFRVLWRALDRAARPDLLNVLVDNGERILDVVERYATEVQRSFLAEEQLMQQQQRTARDRALAKLFSASTSLAEIERVGVTLGVSTDATFELVAMFTSKLTDGLRKQLPAMGAWAYEAGEVSYIFRQRRGSLDWPETTETIRGGYVGMVRGLSAIERAGVLARQLISTRSDSGVITLKEGFSELALRAISGQIAGFEHELIGGFQDLDDETRERLAPTLRSFMNTGSVQLTADEMYLHRNTVFKRLRAFQEATGLDVSVPRDASIALILLQA